jgi:hypothetical protein
LGLGAGHDSERRLTCEVIFLRRVVPNKERCFEVVHVDESVAKKERQKGHTTRTGASLLRLHEGCSPERKQKEINAAKG